MMKNKYLLFAGWNFSSNHPPETKIQEDFETELEAMCAVEKLRDDEYPDGYCFKIYGGEYNWAFILNTETFEIKHL